MTRSNSFVLIIDACPCCNTPAQSRIINSEEYALVRKQNGAHECTSSDTVFGGGACCNLIGHSVQPL